MRRSVIYAYALLLTVATTSVSLSSAARTPQFDANHKFSASSVEFPSEGVTHLEPVQGYILQHEDNHHIHQAYAEGTLGFLELDDLFNNVANSLAAHSLKEREYNGMVQPFPHELALTFHAYGEKFHLAPLRLSTGLYVADSTTTVMNAETGEETEIPNVLQSYHMLDTNAGIEATATVHQSGLFHALVRKTNADGSVETFQVDPLTVHRQHVDDSTYSALDRSTPHGLVVFKHSHVKDQTESHQCGALVPPNREQEREEEHIKALKAAGMEGSSNSELLVNVSDSKAAAVPSLSTQRRLLANLPIGSGITRWTNCYPGDTSSQKVSVGVAADSGFYKIYNSVSATQAAISAVYSNLNLVYVAQFNIYVQIDQFLIQSTTGGLAWNNEPPSGTVRCTITIDNDLNAFTSWRTSTKPKTDSLWHLMTNCFPPAGTVGLAWMGVICSSTYGTGVSSFSQTHWLTVAHETGHNFGASHSFQLGQGTTGGIMDYGDGIWPIGSGIYQFNTVYNKDEMCKEIASALGTTGFTPFCFATYTPTCGNGVVESGEDCDDTSSCCVSCKLKSGAVCTPGTGNINVCCDSTCQFKPSSTSCGIKSAAGNLQSYCSNGVCTSSACNAYSNLEYCGIKGTNPCRQSCLYNGQCIDSFSTPNLNMPDGVVCSQSPYSTCASGVCKAASTTTTTYKWVTSNPSACSCSGTQTLTVQCQDSNGNVSPSTSCTGTAPATTQACTPPTTCVQWKAGGFGACSNDCGSAGTQTQTVVCVQSSNTAVTVASSLCAGLTMPPTSQACTPAAACPTQWVVSGFSACTQSCGGGTQTQTVVCQQTQNGVKSTVTSTACTGTKPATSQACNTAACAGGYSWSYGVFTTCSVTCGSGVQTRSATCMQNGVAVAAASCSGTAGAAVTSQACNTAACPNRMWVAAAWTTCSLSCGSGIQTRAVQCFDAANDPTYTTPLTDDYCINTKPLSMQSCNTQSCSGASSLQWYTDSWSTCSADCQTAGGGISTRAVRCINSNDATKADQGDAACTASTTAGPKPATQQVCNQNGCAAYEWLGGDFGSCSVACGGGVQTRKVACTDTTSKAVVDGSFCSGSPIADTSACNTDTCVAGATGTWRVGSFSNCSVECGTGTRNRAVDCVDANGAVITASSCTTTMPASSSSCSTGACGTYWYTSSWSSCSASCGLTGGTQTRTVSCLKLTDDPANATPLSASACSNSKPSTQNVCNAVPCPAYIPSTDWSSCSTRCNQGFQSRNVSCQSFDGRVIDNSYCAGATMPQVQRVCMDIPCPHWHRGDWGLCSQNCGSGIQNRTLACRMPHDNTTWFGMIQPDSSLCPPPGVGDVGDGVGQPGVAAGQPPLFQTCSITACPTYYWRLSPYTPCSASCGPSGVTTTTATCVSASTGAPAGSDSLCLDAQPPLSIACNTGVPCPIYEWVTQDWNDCQSFCGTSVQNRTVSCFNTQPDPNLHLPAIKVDDQFCAGIAKPALTQTCSLNPESICYGATAAIIRNGRCDTTLGRCVCRSGFVGSDCSVHGDISSVQTNGAQFTLGVPLGEPLLITWNASLANFPTVNIILTKNFTGVDGSHFGTEWQVGEYLGSSVLNSGFFQWSVGSKIDDLEAGNGYRVRVWFSKNLYQDSAPFTIADPCAYKNCSVHGTCVIGQCVCTGGFSGDSCQTGPCQKAGCSPSYSTCDNTAVVTSPVVPANVCSCKSGYSGTQCKTPSQCASAINCLNGGDMDPTTAIIANSSCTAQCACANNWNGNDCSLCALMCQSGGVPDANCNRCVCAPGFIGKQCRCQYYTFLMRFNANWAAWSTNAVAVARFSRSLSADIQIAALASVTATPATVVVESVSFNIENKVDALVRFAIACPDASLLKSGGGSISENSGNAVLIEGNAHVSESFLSQSESRRFERSLAAVAAAAAATNGSDSGNGASPSLSDIYLLGLRPFFEDMDSPLWNGIVTSQMDPSFTTVASDPSGQTTLSQPAQATDCFNSVCTGSAVVPAGGSSSSSSKLPLIIGVVVAGCVVLLAIIGFVCYRLSKKGTSATAATTSRMATEMTNQV